MGGNQSQISNIGTTKGQGYRIINVRVNSPLQKLVDNFFDFIIDVIPTKEPQRSPKQILGKLTNDDSKKVNKSLKSLQQVFKENQNSPVTLKIVSTKYRNVRTIQFTPNNSWDGKQDLAGFQTRLERYDQAFDTYFPFSQIRQGSPVKKAGIQAGEFLIGCLQFKYVSINQLLENLYDRYFDKSVQCKTVNFAVYNIANDQLKIVPVLLARGWGQKGEKGLLGCQFLQGHLNRFPKNLQQVRQSLVLKKKHSDDTSKIKKQLSQCNGASVQLIQSLKNQKNRKKKNIKQLKNFLLIEPSRNFKQTQKVNSPKMQLHQNENNLSQTKKQQQKQLPSKNTGQYVSSVKFKQLQNRVTTLQQMLVNIKNYIEQIQDDSDDQA